MGVISYIKEEIKVVKERDPAIKSDIEVLLYPSFKVMLHYRIAHKLYLKKHYFLARGCHSVVSERQELRSIREQPLERGFLSTMEVALSSARLQSWAIILHCIRG